MSSKTSNQQNQMKSFYRQKKKNDTAKSSSSSSSKKSHSASATLGSEVTQSLSLPYAGSSDLQDERFESKEEEVLRQFDMNMAYGPCLGMSRLDRWDRASRLGLNPPKEVRGLLDLNGSDARSCSLWDGRI